MTMQASQQQSPANPIPLCVDLDNTLIRSDILWESIVPVMKRPGVGLRAFWSLLRRGKAAMKQDLAAEVAIDPSALPYREDLLSFLQAERAAGRQMFLVTATHISIAQGIADYLKLFDGVLATDREINLGGEKKRQLLEQTFGSKGFDYIGDHVKDIPVFSAARFSMLVDPSSALKKKAAAAGDVTRIFPQQRRWPKLLLRALRVHQWSKNALLGVPLVTAHMIFDWSAWHNLMLAFISFSLLASATYLINDLHDLPADRKHVKKRHRPLANGDLPIPYGIALFLILTGISVALAWLLLPPAFTGYLIFYAVVTLSYSFDLKRRLLVDVLTLAILYTVRITAGGAAIGVTVSEWLLMFSLFIFISLAFLKRLIELKGSEGTESIPGRGYSATDLEVIRSVGPASGLMSVLVLTLYINSPAVNPLYSAPKLLWLLSPVLIYWITRIWFLAERMQVNHDPIVFAITDRRTHAVLLISGVILFFAKFGLPGVFF